MNMLLRERRSHVRTFEVIETKSLRRRMEAAIETLIATLDALDGDGDLEAANDDEPSLGWPDVGRGAAGRLDGPALDAGDDDREFDDCDDEDGRDRERDTSDDEDTGDAESDPAELGIGDLDALQDPTLGFDCRDLAFDGSGKAAAEAMLGRGRAAP